MGLQLTPSIDYSVRTQTPLVISEMPLDNSPSPQSETIKTEITSTLLPTPTFTDPPPQYILRISDESLIGITDVDTLKMYIVNLYTGEKYQLISLSGTLSTLIGQSTDGCKLVVGFSDGKYVQIDLHGSIVRELLDTKNLVSVVLTQSKVSHNEDGFAYIIGSGYHNYDKYEYQDLEIVFVNNIKNPILVSKNRSVTDFVWMKS